MQEDGNCQTFKNATTAVNRKLVTIRQVRETKLIEGADLIELAFVDGWQCVAKKGEFAVGDLAVYAEVDSFLPVEPRYEFLRKSSLRKMGEVEGFRLKTMKLRKQLSQGLLMPLREFPELVGKVVGEDVTELLHVVKWEPPIPACLAGKAKGVFPGFIMKTDEERIQNLTEYFEQYKDTFFEESIKMDGTSGTFYIRDGVFGVCSRNLELLESDTNTFWEIANTLHLYERLASLNRNIALQGEVIGEGINSNNEKLKGHHFRLFNIFDIDKGRLLSYTERNELLEQLNNHALVKILSVPVLGVRQTLKEHPTMESLLAYAEGPSMNTQVQREGLVFKSEMVDGRIVSFKAISNAYLLKEKDSIQ